MKNAIKTISISVLFMSVIGCASVAEGPAYSVAKAKENKEGYATLYILREYAEPTAWGATIHIDGKEVSTLNQGGFTWVYAKPGKRDITAVWPGLSGQKDSKILLELAKGKKYYVDLTGVSRLSGVSGGSMYFSVGSGLNGVHPTMAEQRLEKCCKYQKPVSDTY